jgi:hypothetical protein
MLTAAALSLALVCVHAGLGSARPNAEAEIPADGAKARTEVIVFEIGGCKYCVAFRDNLGARYLSSTTNKAAPLRYVDIGQLDPTNFQLRADITTVPTIVVLQDGREVDRVEGYPLRDVLFEMVKSRVGPSAE